MNVLCQGCGRILPPEALTYRLRVELFASPEPPAIGPKDLEGDPRTEWDALLEAMERMTDDEVREATDQIHELYEFVLCARCRALWHDRLREINAQLGME